MIRILQECDIAAADAIIEMQIGEDYSKIKDQINSKNQLVLGWFDPNLQGLVVVGIHPTMDDWIIDIAKDLISELSYSDLLEYLFEEEFIGFFDTVATHPDHVGKGIASKLLQESLMWFDGQVKFIIATAWISKRGINIQKPLERCGFEFIKELKQYYCHSLDCLECGQYNNCQCSAALYVKYINS